MGFKISNKPINSTYAKGCIYITPHCIERNGVGFTFQNKLWRTDRVLDQSVSGYVCVKGIHFWVRVPIA